LTDWHLASFGSPFQFFHSHLARSVD